MNETQQQQFSFVVVRFGFELKRKLKQKIINKYHNFVGGFIHGTNLICVRTLSIDSVCVLYMMCV